MPHCITKLCSLYAHIRWETLFSKIFCFLFIMIFQLISIFRQPQFDFGQPILTKCWTGWISYLTDLSSDYCRQKMFESDKQSCYVQNLVIHTVLSDINQLLGNKMGKQLHIKVTCSGLWSSPLGLPAWSLVLVFHPETNNELKKHINEQRDT